MMGILILFFVLDANSCVSAQRRCWDARNEVLFSDIEIAPLRDCAKDRKQSEPDNLGDAVLTMAKLGGYLNRKNDPAARVQEDLGRIHPSGGDGTDL